MKRIITALALAVVLPSAGAASAGFKAQYKMQVNVGPTTCWGMGAAKFAELAREETGGKINIKPYYGSQLLRGAQLNSVQMVAMGAIDCAFDSTINTAPVVPGMNIFCLPFFVGSFENVDRLESGQTGALLFRALEKKGVVPLAWGENGFRQITNSRRPIASPGDLAGLRVRVVGSPLFIDIFRRLGADPINMNWGDAITAFQQGTVDGQENPVSILVSVQIFQYHKQITLWNYLIDPLIIYWNRAEWDAFPEEVRKGLRKAALRAARFEKALVRVGLDDGESLRILRNEFGYSPSVIDPLGYLESKGMKITRLSDKQREAFRKATKPVLDRWVPKVGEEIYRAALRDMKK